MTNKPSRHKPILVDDSLNRAFAIKNTIYLIFGISGIVTHIPSLAIIAGEIPAMILSAIVALSAAGAAVSAWNSMKGEIWVRRELWATIVMVAFVSMYSIALVILAINGVGNRVNLAIISSALLVMPAWRITYLLKKIRNA